jgi:serine/threonine-protein kinase
LPPSAVNPKVPKAFDAPLLRALSRDAKGRHATARELALELEKCAGIASPTEVGEWVENVVGPVLSAREDQIAAIESSSAALRVSQSGRPVPDTPSDSDISDVLGAPAGAIVGLGPTSGTHQRDRKSQRNLAPPTPTAPTIPNALYSEGTGSKLTGSKLMLPVDRRLPILATLAGLAVLVVVVGIVLAGRFSESPADAKPGQGLIAPPPPPLPAAEPSIPPPPPSIAAAPPPDTVEPPPKPIPKAKPPAPPAPAAAPAPKKNCDPNYWIDEKGHKRYKIECM